VGRTRQERIAARGRLFRRRNEPAERQRAKPHAATREQFAPRQGQVLKWKSVVHVGVPVADGL
jgi:hypothetical protein